MRFVTAFVLLFTVAACVHSADEPVTSAPPDLNDQAAKTSYSVGYQVGSDFRHQGVEIRPDSVIQGIQDAMAGTQPQMTPQEMRATLVSLAQRVAERAKAEKDAALVAARQRDADFLAAYAGREGVVTTASGLQYRVITPGSGASPSPNDTVTVHYRGTLTDGDEFDSSYSRGKPMTFRLDQVIAGWQEALQLMHEGAKCEFVIPSQLAYGDRGPLAGRVLVFEVELLSIN